MKNKKDILLLCQFFYPEYVSSATLPYDTAVALSEAGFSVGVLCGYPKEYSLGKDIPKKEIHKNIYIKRLKYLQLKRSNFIGRIINYFSFTASVAFNIGYLIKFKTILVYSNPPVLPIVPAIVNKFFKVKIIFVCYDVYPEIALTTNSISESGFISKMMKMANKMIFNSVEMVVALSDEMKRFLINNRPQISDRQIRVIPNWSDGKINNKDVKNLEFKELKGDNNLIVSYFGNMGICQDMNTIIDAMRQLKNNSNIKFLFAGHGNKMKKIKEIVKKENLNNVKIYDFLHGRDFEEALNISDCFLLSLKEGLTGLCVPSKTYSYMMAGKPIIAIMEKDSDIVRDLEEYNCGYSMEVGEYEKLVKAIEKLYSNDVSRKTMGENCKRLFLEKYTKEKCTKEYIDMMKNILEG